MSPMAEWPQIMECNIARPLNVENVLIDAMLVMIIFIHQNGRNTYEEKKYSNYKITLTIGNGEHVKHTLSTSTHNPYQQHLPKIS